MNQAFAYALYFVGAAVAAFGAVTLLTMAMNALVRRLERRRGRGQR